MLRAWPAYWFTVSAGGAFLYCSALTVQGAAANLLPRPFYLRVSALLQAATLSVVLISYLLEPRLSTTSALMAAGSRRLLTWLPTYWFLGMFHQVNGSMSPVLVPLARRAWMGLAVSVLGAAGTLLLSYLRMLTKIVEQPDIVPLRRARIWSPNFGSSLPATITLFGLRTLQRSRQHRMILSFYFGIGLAVLMGYIQISSHDPAASASGVPITVLVASTLMMILMLLALRVVATIPISLRANWIFRATQTRPLRPYCTGVRTMFVVLGVAPVWLMMTAVALCGVCPWRPMIGHLLALFFLGMLLVELCLYGFHKIPFACSYLPGKANVHFVFWGSLAPFIVMLDQAARIESRILGDLRGSIFMILGIATLAGAGRWINEALANPADDLLFEEEDPPVFISLKLH